MFFNAFCSSHLAHCIDWEACIPLCFSCTLPFALHRWERAPRQPFGPAQHSHQRPPTRLNLAVLPIDRLCFLHDHVLTSGQNLLPPLLGPLCSDHPAASSPAPPLNAQCSPHLARYPESLICATCYLDYRGTLGTIRDLNRRLGTITICAAPSQVASAEHPAFKNEHCALLTPRGKQLITMEKQLRWNMLTSPRLILSPPKRTLPGPGARYSPPPGATALAAQTILPWSKSTGDRPACGDHLCRTRTVQFHAYPTPDSVLFLRHGVGS